MHSLMIDEQWHIYVKLLKPLYQVLSCNENSYRNILISAFFFTVCIRYLYLKSNIIFTEIFLPWFLTMLHTFPSGVPSYCYINFEVQSTCSWNLLLKEAFVLVVNFSPLICWGDNLTVQYWYLILKPVKYYYAGISSLCF